MELITLKSCCTKKNRRPVFNSISDTIYRISVDSGEVPMIWREVNVSPIFKKESKLEPVNYRPVSLISVVCRTLESIHKDSVIKYSTENDLISSDQHAVLSQIKLVTQIC